MFGRTIQRLSHNIVLKRRLPSRFGGEIIFASPGVALGFGRFNLDKVDPMLFKAALELVRSGDIVWDVGSSVSLFSLASAALAGPSGRVLSIEPDTWSVDLLHQSVRIRSNSRARIDVLPVAISDSIDIVVLIISRQGRAGNLIKELSSCSQNERVFENELVITVTLDWLLDRYPAPNVVKINVGGG